MEGVTQAPMRRAAGARKTATVTDATVAVDDLAVLLSD
jgi:hypothetical protein